MDDEKHKLRSIRLPRFSWDYEDLNIADHWFLMARAYLDCSKYLFSQMINDALDSSFFHAKVSFGLFSHSLELFLKGGIIQAGGEVFNTHDLQQTYNQFRNLYPGKKFEFEGDVANAVRSNPQTPYSEFARYPTDHLGQQWSGNTHIDLVVWFQQLLLFSSDYERLEPLIKQHYSSNAEEKDT